MCFFLIQVTQPSVQRANTILPMQVIKKKQTNRLENILFRLKQPAQADDSSAVVNMVSGSSPEDSEDDKVERVLKCSIPGNIQISKACRRSRKTQKEPTKRYDGRLLESFGLVQDTAAGCPEKTFQSQEVHRVKQEENGKAPLNEPEWLTCSVCEIVCQSIDDLLIHQQGHTDAAVFPCAQCKSKFSSPYELKVHTEDHIKEYLGASAVHSSRMSEQYFLKVDEDSLHQISQLNEKESQDFKFSMPELPSSIVKHTYTPQNMEKRGFIVGTQRHRCDNCHRVFTSVESLQQHKCRKGLVTPFGCGKCGRCFKQFTNLIEHSVIHNGDTLEELECYECGEKFKLSIDLRKHVSVHISLEFRTYSTAHTSGKPKINAGDDSNDGSDIIHKKSRKRKKPPVTDANRCKVCNKVFPHRSYLHVHMQVHDEKRFACDYCEKKFTFKKSLEIHLRSHTGEKPYHCELCDRYFTRQDALNKHRRLHLGVKPYVCDICGRQFGDGFELRRHINSHSKLKPYKCTVCDKAYTDNSRLKEHMFRHSGNLPFICERCGKGFARKYRYNLHMSHHMGEVRFSCEICGKGFLRRSDYNTHKMTHTSDRPYKCKHCGMGFIRDNYLKRHEVVHSGEKPYKCSICGKNFARKNTLTRHKLTHGKKSDGTIHGHFGSDYGPDVKGMMTPLDASDGEERDILKDIQAVIGVSVAGIFE